MGTRAKLVALSLGTLAIGLPLLVLVAVPAPQAPGMVDRIDLPDEAASPAAVDPPEEPEPADGDPPEESEPADGEPPM